MKSSMSDSQSNEAGKKYSESDCFELYCLSGGSITTMLTTQQPTKQQMPSQATLYRYEKEFNWRQRYSNIAEVVSKQAHEEVAMAYDRINKFSSIVLFGLNKRLMNAIERGDYSVFSIKMLESLWKIQRTERGLPTQVRQEPPSHPTSMDKLESELETINPVLAKVLKNITPEFAQKLLVDLGSEELAQSPALLKRR